MLTFCQYKQKWNRSFYNLIKKQRYFDLGDMEIYYITIN